MKRAQSGNRLAMFGLKSLETVTKKDYLARVKHLNKLIDSGKLKGDKLFKAGKDRDMYAFKARHFGKKSKAPKVKLTKAQKNFNPNQMILPKFLSQLSVVRIEEMVADRMASQMMANIQTSVAKKSRKAS